MKAVANFFCRAEAWQIFFLGFGFYCVGFFSQMMLWANQQASGSTWDPRRLVADAFIFAGMFSFLAWLWSMGSFLNSVTPHELRLRTALFHVAVIFPAFYFPVFLVFVFTPTPIQPTFSVIVPLHLFAMFCMFYSLYFTSKSLVQVETGRAVAFYDYAGAFFLMWFFPIGIWLVQPRINRLFATSGMRTG